MASSWEVVSSKSKKSNAPVGRERKSREKILAENMPRLSTAVPVKESPTIYDAFLEKERRAAEKASGKEQVKPVAETVTTNGHPGRAKPKKKGAPEKSHKNAKMSLEEAVKLIDCNEVQTVLTKDEDTFPETPSVWLKDLASILNLRLDQVPEPDPVFQGKPSEYPLCQLPANVKKLLTNVLNKCSTRTLELFMEHCIQQMINDIGKGMPTYGYRMLIQMVAFDKPSIIINNLEKSLELLKSHQNRPLRCLSIMWAIGQAGHNDLANGLKVWLELMLPVLNIRALSTYGIDYLDRLFKKHKNMKSAYNLISLRNFFPILDLIYGNSQSLPPNLQKKLLALYPQIKKLSFGDEPKSNLRNFFPSFLARAVPNANKHLRMEVLKSLVECLETDKQCFSVWRQMYTKHLTHSSLLLQYLVTNWEDVEKRLDKKVLRETIQAFNITNDELAVQGHGGGEGYNGCVSSCKELLDRISTMRFPWRFLLFLFVATLGGLFTYDVYTSGSVKDSRTVKFLDESGTLVFLEQSWQRIRLFAGEAWMWLQVNVPYYYAKTVEFTTPYLQLVWEKLCELGAWLVEVSKPLKDWLAIKIPILLEWLQEKVPWLCEAVTHYATVAWHWVVQTSFWLAHLTVEYTHTAGTWLQENVFTGQLSGENIQNTLSSSVAVMQNYSVSFIQWCSARGSELWAGKSEVPSTPPPATAAGA